MTQLQKLKLYIPDETNDVLLQDILDRAKMEILTRRFPFVDELPDEIEPRYEGLQIEIAIEIYNKQGAEGEKHHQDGTGVSRTYENAGISQSLLAKIVPKGKIL